VPGPAKGSRPAPSAGGGATGLSALLYQGVTLPPARESMLREAMASGREFFDAYNDARIELALAGFDSDMLHALYETLFLLNTNDPRLAQWTFSPQRPEGKGARRKPEPRQTAALYLEGAPAGVQGLAQLSPRFRADFRAYVQEVFGIEPLPPRGGHAPIVSVHSIGSIGTIGHKPRASDLDLQVVYSLEPFRYDTAALNDDVLREALRRDMAGAMREIAQRRRLSRDQMKNPVAQKMLQGAAMEDIAKRYPNLHKYLIRRQGDYREDFKGAGGEPLRIQCLHEVINLLKRSQKIVQEKELAAAEALLKERIACIQDYLGRRFPEAEVYLFPMSIDAYRQGKYSSTVEFKESSGSAYELILNYETLMPGIHFNPVVPSHFVFPEEVNNNGALYARLSDYIRFGTVRLYEPLETRLVNLGAAPNLSTEYVARHSGAAYWEAFKASSGNLPKAILNLFRYEMLLEPRYLKTVIQLIKSPAALDGFGSPRPAETKPVKPGTETDGLPAWQVLEMEEAFPLLRREPWWLRYKALKIAFAEKEGVPGLEPEERARVSRAVDLAFALHCRVSDVFAKPGERKALDSFREQVLADLLQRAFPPGSLQRQRVEQLFIGDVHAVNEFERELRDLFKRSLARVKGKVAAFSLGDDQGAREEFAIWNHYYQDNFDPKPAMVQRSIMHQLKVPRGRLQIAFNAGKGWSFSSLQRESSVGKRFDTFGTLDHLPDVVTLTESPSFLEGLAHCIINAYYGVMNAGTLKEYQTALEFDGARLDLGHPVHNTLAFLRPDQVDRILHIVMEHFPSRQYSYLDVTRAERRVAEVLVFVNLWHFGRLSVLYRDNLRAVYCQEFDHPDLLKIHKQISASPEALLTRPEIQTTLGSFFDTNKVLLGETRLAVWVNPNSVTTTHAPTQTVQKETELARMFETIVRDVHGR